MSLVFYVACAGLWAIGLSYDLDSNMIIAGAAQMQPPPQLQPEREPDMVELREAPQIFHR